MCKNKTKQNKTQISDRTPLSVREQKLFTKIEKRGGEGRERGRRAREAEIVSQNLKKGVIGVGKDSFIAKFR